MLSEQNIEFELRRLVPLAVRVLLQLVIFMTKNLLKKNFEWIIIYSLRQYFSNEVLPEAMYLASPYVGRTTSKI